jgi:hypothetical protein
MPQSQNACHKGALPFQQRARKLGELESTFVSTIGIDCALTLKLTGRRAAKLADDPVEQDVRRENGVDDVAGMVVRQRYFHANLPHAT